MPCAMPCAMLSAIPHATHHALQTRAQNITTRTTQTLNESHTEQDRKAEEIANEEGRQTEKIPIPEEMRSIENEKGLCIHSKIRKTVEKEIRDEIFPEYIDEKEEDQYKRADLRKTISKVETTNNETQDNWKKAIQGGLGAGSN